MPLDHLLAASTQRLTLSSDDVHVWQAAVDQPAPTLLRLTETLSADERERAGRFFLDHHRRRFIVGRGLLRVILSCYTGINPSELQFTYGRLGKPALPESSSGRGLRFNLSHSQGLAVYGITRGREIGVDVERVRAIPDTERIAAQFFSAGERATFREIPAGKRPEAFFSCWTCKEAYAKATGDGLARSFERIEISLVPGERARISTIDGSPEEASRWSIWELIPDYGYVGALVVEGCCLRLTSFRWPES